MVVGDSFFFEKKATFGNGGFALVSKRSLSLIPWFLSSIDKI